MKRLFKRLVKDADCLGLTEDGYFSIDDCLIIKQDLLDKVGIDYQSVKAKKNTEIKNFTSLWNDFFILKEKYPDKVADSQVKVYDVPLDCNREEKTVGLLNTPVYLYEIDGNYFRFNKEYIDLIEKLIEKNKKKNVNRKIYYFEFTYICRSRYYDDVDYLKQDVAIMVWYDENGQILADVSGFKEEE